MSCLVAPQSERTLGPPLYPQSQRHLRPGEPLLEFRRFHAVGVVPLLVSHIL